MNTFFNFWKLNRKNQSIRDGNILFEGYDTGGECIEFVSNEHCFPIYYNFSLFSVNFLYA